MRRAAWVTVACALLWLAAVGLDAAAQGGAAPNGFMLSPSAIPANEILSGGPPRDGIPALDDPVHVAADAAPWDDGEMVVGVEIGGQARAYPISVLAWHELVNDDIAGTPVLVSYCPLCGTALVFDRRLDGVARRFGVSGLLYRSDLLMFDRETESLWSQIRGRAETGPSLGKRLTLVRSRMERWGRWKRAHPQTRVLSPETGHQRDYASTPYGDYDSSEAIYFPVSVDERYHPKMPTLGVRLADGSARAYPAAEVRAAGGSVSESFGGHAIRVRYDGDARVFDIDAGPAVEVVEGYWFAWVAFHPTTEVFIAPESKPTKDASVPVP